MPIAVIDIGTNTLLLLIVDQAMHPLVDLCRFGRLGKGLDATGRLADDAIATSLEICREYRAVMDGCGVARPTVIATQAAREAANADDFLGPAQQILGAPIQVIAGERLDTFSYRRRFLFGRLQLALNARRRRPGRQFQPVPRPLKQRKKRKGPRRRRKPPSPNTRFRSVAKK